MKGITGNPALDAYHRMAVTPVGAARPVERPAGAATSTNTGGAAAEVKISARARDLAAEANSHVDAQKVEALKQRIAEGSFRIDAQAVANKLIEQLG